MIVNQRTNERWTELDRTRAIKWKGTVCEDRDATTIVSLIDFPRRKEE